MHTVQYCTELILLRQDAETAFELELENGEARLEDDIHYFIIVYRTVDTSYATVVKGTR